MKITIVRFILIGFVFIFARNIAWSDSTAQVSVPVIEGWIYDESNGTVIEGTNVIMIESSDETGHSNEAFNFHLARAGIVIGLVSDVSNQLIKGAHLVLKYTKSDGFPLAVKTIGGTFETKGDGSFRIRNVEPHRPARIIVGHPNYKSYVSEIFVLSPGEELMLNIVLNQ